MLVVLLVVPLVLALLGGAHWYVWRRLVRDVTRPGGTARRAGTVAVVVLPLFSVAAMTAGRADAPFRLQQVVSWPGFLWLALLLYLVLTLLATELLRPVLTRWPRPRRATLSPEGPPPGLPTEAPHPAVGIGSSPKDFVQGGSPGRLGEGGHSGPVGHTPVDPAPDGGTALATAPPEEVPAAEALEGATHADSMTAKPQETPGAEPQEGLGAGGPGMGRRRFVARVLAGTAVAVATGTVANGAHTVLRGPTVKRVTVPLAKLPRSAHGYRIAVVSDIHLGPTLGRAHAQRIVDAVNSTQPDLVAVVGDLVDGSVENLGPAAEPLARFRARHGSFFVTGNHEYFSGAEEWVDEVRDLGMRPLRNERVEIAAGFDLAGVNDVAGANYGDGPDFVRALGDRDRARTAVLLAHQPVMIHDAVRHGVDLQLSGHTHGGQMWPGNLLAELANPTVEGLERYGDTQLYVSRGAGAWGPPVRVGAPSDITVVQLASRQT
ncbi:metallophosphoesterase [Streptomyces thermolilacinus]|uniref:metallophosphoesterase n=1 Tax=Streptomyces thermolilacinus TaxID=285540 RepID=UPI0033FBD8ED